MNARELTSRARALADIASMGEGPHVEEALYEFASHATADTPHISVDSWEALITTFHQAGVDDQNIPPIVVVDASNQPVGELHDGDTVLYWNFRTDRAKPLTAALIATPSEDQIGGLIAPAAFRQIHMVTMTEYDGRFDGKLDVAFAPDPVTDTYAEVIGRLPEGVRQLVVGESEKRRAIDWFKNGRRSIGFVPAGQVDEVSQRFIQEALHSTMIVVDSRKVRSHDAKPQMRAKEITDHLIAGMREGVEDIFVNYANADMVGHAVTRPALFDAAVAAILELDVQLERLVATAREAGYTVLISADHGNAEEVLVTEQATGAIGAHPGHTTHKIPLIVLGLGADESVHVRTEATLSDLAPTMLQLRGIIPPASWDRTSALAGTIVPDVRRKIMRVILDGYGIRGETFGNAMASASERQQAARGRPLHMDRWMAGEDAAVFGAIEASGALLGYGEGIAGTTEFGHVLMDAGRSIDSDKVIIDEAIAAGDFQTKPALVDAMRRVADGQGRLHLMGLITTKFVHASMDHIAQLLDMAAQQGLGRDQVCLHLLTDGRDEANNALPALHQIQGLMERYQVGHIATIGARAWGMDRDNRWHRITPHYRALVESVAAFRVHIRTCS